MLAMVGEVCATSFDLGEEVAMFGSEVEAILYFRAFF
jgi:hypothetical protein